jgi:hypothetical protein
VSDTIAPVFVNPPIDETYSCIVEVPAIGNLSWNDNCGETGSTPGMESSTGTCPQVITRTWTAVDACGNETTYVQTITINDLIPPVIDPPPANTSVQCPTNLPPFIDLNYNDNCDAPGVAQKVQVSDDENCPETITRKWFYTDACQNTSDTVYQVITIDDTTLPVFDNPPPPVTVECMSDYPAMTQLMWTDNCDGSGLVDGVDIPNPGTCPRIITRSWTHFDSCGNIALTAIQSITIDDTTDPVLDPAPNDTLVQCIDDLSAAIDLNYTDNCSPSGSVSPVETQNSVGCITTITRTWTVTDSCNNTAEEMQTIVVLP